MTLLKIAEVGHPILRQPARTLSSEEILSERYQRLIDDMIETMHDANGAGIAAPQVYEPVQLAVIEVRGNNPRYPYKPPIPLTVVINPVITPVEETMFDNYEGCLSVPNIRGVVKRYAHIRLDYLDREAKPHSEIYRGISAGTFQHELDHLHGKIFLDRVTDPTTLTTWRNFDDYQKELFVEHVKKVVAEWGS